MGCGRIEYKAEGVGAETRLITHDMVLYTCIYFLYRVPQVSLTTILVTICASTVRHGSSSAFVCGLQEETIELSQG